MTKQQPTPEFPGFFYISDRTMIGEVAQRRANENEAPVAVLSRDDESLWAICEEPPDQMEPDPTTQGWTIRAIVTPEEPPTPAEIAAAPPPPNALWIVTFPTRRSTLADILFSTTPAQLHNQFRGGLQGDEIAFWSFSQADAFERAEALLHLALAEGRAADRVIAGDIPAGRWIVRCRVSGGVTGTRESVLHTDDSVSTFATEAEAAAVARELTRTTNSRTAEFQYWAAPERAR